MPSKFSWKFGFKSLNGWFIIQKITLCLPWHRSHVFIYISTLCIWVNSSLCAQPNSYHSVLSKCYRQYNQMKTLDIWHSKSIHLISFKLTASIADTNRCLHVNFLSNQTNFKVGKNILNWLNKGRVVFYRNVGTQAFVYIQFCYSNMILYCLMLFIPYPLWLL